MTSFTDALNIWGIGQLLAFSGIDGPTSWVEPLVLHTGTEPGSLDVKLPVRVLRCAWSNVAARAGPETTTYIRAWHCANLGLPLDRGADATAASVEQRGRRALAQLSTPLQRNRLARGLMGADGSPGQ